MFQNERGVLGVLLAEPTIFDRLARLLSPTHFTLPAHQTIYRAMLDLWARGETTDALTVAEALRQAGTLAEIGGQAMLAGLLEAALERPPPDV